MLLVVLARVSYFSRQPGEALSANQKIVAAPMSFGGDVENAFHLFIVLRSKRFFSSSVPAMYLGHFRDHVRNTSSPSSEPLVPLHVAMPMVTHACQSRGSSSLPSIFRPRR